MKLNRISLVRGVYRTLLNKGRTYAAFDEKKVFPLVESLANNKEILDPMSGYGSLMSYCSKLGIKYYGFEFSSPMYLWQILMHPAHSSKLISCIEQLLSSKNEWPPDTISAKAIVSDDWFPEESKSIIVELFKLTQQCLAQVVLKKATVEELSLALIVPFSGRFSCSVQGDIVTHVKKGGICVYRNWHKDFLAYLSVLKFRLETVKSGAKSKAHIIKLGDSRVVKFPVDRFSAMITSPPYPNSRDYESMYRPENAILAWLKSEKLISHLVDERHPIGSAIVSGRNKSHVRSKTARKFLHQLEEYNGTKRAMYDIKVYYLPYYSNYFSDLEIAYENIAPSLTQNFLGYIIVVNNTARNMVIPVAEIIMEIWQHLGFRAEIYKAEESFHVGTKNPHARGLKAKHTEYTIKVWRK